MSEDFRNCVKEADSEEEINECYEDFEGEGRILEEWIPRRRKRYTKEVGGAPVGYVEVWPQKEGYKIENVYVAPQLRRQGVATDLVEEITEKIPYEKLEWGLTTEEGKELKDSLDERFREQKI